MKQYDFNEAEKTFLKLCERYGIKVIKDGTGQFIMDGKPFDPIEELKREMEFDKKYKHGDNSKAEVRKLSV